MKKFILTISCVCAMLTFVFIACDSEYFQDSVMRNNRKEVLNEAKVWYEANKPQETLFMNSPDSQIVYMTPNWEQAFRRQNENYRIVEAAFRWDKLLTYTTKDSYDAYLETGDKRYLLSKSRLVIRKDRKTNETEGFVMTLVADRSYFEKTNFRPYLDITYLDRKDFSGKIIFNLLDGTLAEGLSYKNGELVATFYDIEHSKASLTRCYGDVYIGDTCWEEEIYSNIQDCYEEYIDEENDITIEICDPPRVIGVTEHCRPDYDKVWDDKCGKNH